MDTAEIKASFPGNEALPAAVAHCGKHFERFAACMVDVDDRVRASPEYVRLVQHVQELEANQLTPPRLLELARGRAQNEFLKAEISECGYARTPLRECLADFTCAGGDFSRAHPDQSVEILYHRIACIERFQRAMTEKSRSKPLSK